MNHGAPKCTRARLQRLPVRTAMIRTLTIDGFRAFRHFEMEGLGRVNLLVGANNCGKSTVLEAVHCLAARQLGALLATLRQRGELGVDAAGRSAVYDIGHLFHGHIVARGGEFRIGADGSESGPQSLAVTIGDARLTSFGPNDKGDALPFLESLDPEEYFEISMRGALELCAVWSQGATAKTTTWAEISRAGTVSADRLRDPLDAAAAGSRPVFMIPTSSLAVDRLLDLWDAVVLTTEERYVIEALQSIEPTIERLATVSVGRNRIGAGLGSRVVLGLAGSSKRIPIGSMGDGLARLLGLAVTLVRSAGGIVLIDEIDTGLHYSVMCDMWKMVAETAKRLDIQVFATTHSRDCVDALASISTHERNDGANVSIQRIERGRDRAVAFGERDIVIAAQRGIEVR